MPARKKTTKYRGQATSRPNSRRPGARGATVSIDDGAARTMDRCRLEPEDLRWTCDPAVFGFSSTREVSPGRGLRARPEFFGQAKAVEAVRMAFEMSSPGYNLFVCGLTGTRKVELIEELARLYTRDSNGNGRKRSSSARNGAKGSAPRPDRCYVQNFDDPRRPKLLELPPGQGRKLQAEISALIHRLQVDLEKLPDKQWRPKATEILGKRIPTLVRKFRDPEAQTWLQGWGDALLRDLRHIAIEDFEVNCLGQPAAADGPRVVVETNPTHANLFGWIGRRSFGEQSSRPHFTEIQRGTFLEADGGVLILDASDAISSPGTWTTLKNCVKYGSLEIQDGDPSAPPRSATLKPEPIPTSVKVVLLGEYLLFDYIFEADPDFAEAFKIRVDFSSETNLTSRVTKRDVPSLIASLCAQEDLLDVAPSGVAKIVEYGVRTAGRQNKITTQTNVFEDVLREADYWARQSRRRKITGGDVDRAIDEAIARVNLVEKKISEMIAEGTILITTSGARVGQVNGLAIYDMGDYSFGKPSRITAETSVGQGGSINIEREAGFSGRSHDKGVQILCGYLRSCFAQSRPMSLTASVCFEQSYSGIDGDSASATEIYAILSSLSGLAIRQDIAVTGSLSQKGDIQPIGGVNEKIEGFYDCIHQQQGARPTGREGVIIPRKNASDLMLRRDIVEAVKKGRFQIYAIDTVADGIEVLTGVSAGKRRKNGTYPDDSVFARVDARLEELASNLRK